MYTGVPTEANFLFALEEMYNLDLAISGDPIKGFSGVWCVFNMTDEEQSLAMSLRYRGVIQKAGYYWYCVKDKNPAIGICKCL